LKNVMSEGLSRQIRAKKRTGLAIQFMVYK
jgi:hypothetical protein